MSDTTKIIRQLSDELVALQQPIRGHRTLTIIRKGGNIVTIPLAPRTAWPPTCVSANEKRDRSL